MKSLLKLYSSRCLIAANGTRSVEDVAICAANARAFTGEEWEQITPWGEFPNKMGLQRLNKVTGQRMVDAFNSILGKAKQVISPVPVYSGHPDVDSENYKDDRRYGKIEALEVRDDGLWCKPAYNDLGKQNKDQGYWIYPSAVWKFKRMPGGVIEPFELLSVGLTNNPVIKSVQPWTRNAEDRARNAGTSAGAHKGWATRRANGVAGAKNPRAIKALATMSAKKTGRKATSDDKAKAGEKLEKKAPKRGSKSAIGAPKAVPKKTTPPPLPAKIEAKAAPPPLPAPKSTSSSSGAGTHVHIHVGAPDATGSTPAKKGLFSSILEAFAKPHVHDGGAGNALHFDDAFYGRIRRVAVNGRRKTTAAAHANA